MLHKPVKIGVIGCGGYAFQLIKRIWTLPRVAEIAAVTSRRPDSAGAKACAERGVRVFETVEQMLEYGQGQFDAVVNPTPIHLHEPITAQCLEAGFPVFMEKPPVATPEEYETLLGVARTTGQPVAVCFNSIYSHAVQKLKGELVAGRYGQVRRIRNMAAWIRTDAYFHRNDWAGKIRQDGRWILDGTINNPLAHLIANSLYFSANERHLMDMPVSVEAELYHGNSIESEDTSSMRILAQNGVEILSQLTLCAETIVEPVTIIECEEAEIQFSNFDMVKIVFRSGRTEVRESYCESRIDMLEELCIGLRTGERPLCDLEMCLPFILAVNAAFLSSWPVRPLPQTAIRRTPQAESTKVEIPGINQILANAHEKGELFSELRVAWAKPARVTPVTKSTSVDQTNQFPFGVKDCW